MLHQFIHEALKGYKAPKKSCSCGCGGCSDSQPKLALLESKTPISEGLRYHIDNGISLQENVFRIGSKKYLQLFAEARMLHEWGNISLDENSKFLIENTDIGKFGIYEGKKVPLDLPVVNEEYDKGPVNEFLSKLMGKVTKYIGIQKVADIILNKLAERLPVDKQDLILDLKPVIASAISLGKIATVKELIDYLIDNGGEVKDLIAAEIPGLLQKLRLAESSGPFVSTHPWAYGPDDEFGQFTYSDEIQNLAKMVADKMGGEVEGYGVEDGEIIVATNGMDYTVDRQGNIKDKKLSFTEAKKKKKKKDPPIGKPKRGGSKAYYVYVRDPKTKNVKKVSFGSGGLRAKIRNPKARNAFAKRHDCKNKKDRTKASYWSCNLPRYAPALGLGPKMNTYW